MNKIFKKLIAGAMATCVIAASMTVGAGAVEVSDYWEYTWIPSAPSYVPQPRKLTMDLTYYAGYHTAQCTEIFTDGTTMVVYVESADTSRWELSKTVSFSRETETLFTIAPIGEGNSSRSNLIVTFNHNGTGCRTSGEVRY